MIDPEDDNDPEEKIKELYEAIYKLNQVEKAVMFLYLEKCSYREIAEVTGLTEKNVSVLLFRSKKKVKTFLGKPKI
jgi:RNA polymerase sigma-70 factor (ECF subfamily)